MLALLRLLGIKVSKDLEPWKADVASAYRRIPIKPEHREFAGIVFKHDAEVITARHIGLPFGAVASVHNWERVGGLLEAIARRLLHLPVLR